MKANRSLVTLALALAILFLSQFTAEIFFLTGPLPEAGKRIPQPALDLKALSLSSRIFTETAFVWLEAKDENAVKKSMSLLRHSLQRNPLDYQARYYLAKAYLQYSTVSNGYFDLGLRELKRAARIRGSNKQVALDCARVFFSLWPLLEDADKTFAHDLLAAVMPSLSWPEFSPLVEMWSLYVQDPPLLMELLKRKPDFFGPTANQLVAAEIPVAQRHELLALHEVHTLDALERRYNELSLQGDIGLADARSLLNRLLQLKSYYRLKPDCGFAPEKFAKLRRLLLLKVIDGLLGDPQAQADAKTAPLLRRYILSYIAGHSGLTDLDELQKALATRNFFRENDFPSLYLKTLITFGKGGYNDIITEIEALRKTISFVKKEQLADYTNILLLLIDSYYSSKLLTAAEAIARELVQGQPDNPDLLYRVRRVQKILGDEGAPDPELNEKLAVVENSRFLTVARAKSGFDVFLFNQPWIEIMIDPALMATLKPKQLLQVFVDDKIAFESYVEGLPAKIAIGPPFVAIESKVRVQVSVI